MNIYILYHHGRLNVNEQLWRGEISGFVHLTASAISMRSLKNLTPSGTGSENEPSAAASTVATSANGPDGDAEPSTVTAAFAPSAPGRASPAPTVAPTSPNGLT